MNGSNGHGPNGKARLTPRQARFVAEYLKDLNATQAAIRAGYKPSSAQKMGSRLVVESRVSAAISAARSQQEVRTGLTADRVLDELALIAFSDVGDVLDFEGEEPRLRSPKAITPRARRAIMSVKVKRYLEGHGEQAKEVEITEFKFWSKDAALEKLGRHFGLWKDGDADPAGLERLLAILARRQAERTPRRVEYDA